MSSTKTDPKFDNLISFAGFAKLKGVSRNNVQNWVDGGHIIPTSTADGRMINLEVYRDFDPADVKRGPALKNRGIETQLRTLNKRVSEVESRLNEISPNK